MEYFNRMFKDKDPSEGKSNESSENSPNSDGKSESVKSSDRNDSEMSIPEHQEHKLKSAAFDKRPPGHDEIQHSSANSGKQNNPKKCRSGLSRNMAAIFVNSAVSGGTILHLPFTLKESGWFGVFLLILVGINSLYCGMVLSWCWIIMQERWPEYKLETRSPYPEIAFRAAGKWMKYVVTVMVNFNQLGFGLIYLGLISQLVETASFQHLKFCFIMVITTLLIIPLTWFGTPKDFWFFGVIDFLATAIFIVVTICTIFIDKKEVGNYNQYESPRFPEIVSSFGSMIFAYTGGAAIPTIQNDMRNRKFCPHSIYTGYLIILMFYVPLPILGYAAYGKNTSYNILENLSNSNLKGVAVFLHLIFIVHMVMTTIIHLNPTFQNFEDLLNCPKEFGYKRCLIRSGVVIALLPIGFAMPYFSVALEFGGAACINLLTTIFPIVFYLCLVYQRDRKYRERNISRKKVVFLIEIIVLGTVGILATYYMANQKKSMHGDLSINCYTHSSVTNNTLFFLIESKV